MLSELRVKIDMPFENRRWSVEVGHATVPFRQQESYEPVGLRSNPLEERKVDRFATS